MFIAAATLSLIFNPGALSVNPKIELGLNSNTSVIMETHFSKPEGKNLFYDHTLIGGSVVMDDKTLKISAMAPIEHPANLSELNIGYLKNGF